MGKYSHWSTRPLTEKNKRHISYCIYCHKVADSREHVPSKVLLDEPYPDNLIIVPSCKKCNIDFSGDELYTACLADTIRNTLSHKRIDLREKTIKAIEHDNILCEEMRRLAHYDTDKPHFIIKTEPIQRVITKLSLGHIASKLDFVVNPNESLRSCTIRLISDFTYDERITFEELPIIDVAEEAGSDFMQDLIVITGDMKGTINPIALWQDVQTGNYRYIVYPDSENNLLIVRIVICETLFAELRFK